MLKLIPNIKNLLNFFLMFMVHKITAEQKFFNIILNFQHVNIELLIKKIVKSLCHVNIKHSSSNLREFSYQSLNKNIISHVVYKKVLLQNRIRI